MIDNSLRVVEGDSEYEERVTTKIRTWTVECVPINNPVPTDMGITLEMLRDLVARTNQLGGDRLVTLTDDSYESALIVWNTQFEALE